MKVLIVIDMQNDFIDGALGTAEAVAIVENVQRKNLSAIEEAKSYQALLEKGYITQEELAKKMGLSQSAIANKLRLLQLDESVQEAVIDEKISERQTKIQIRIAGCSKQKKSVGFFEE